MSRAIVTQELADTLRNMRLQNKVQAKAVADHIGKSPAYISKLESMQIQSIDTEELFNIIKFVVGDSADLTELGEKIYASLKFKYSKKEIDSQLWFTNFDTVECQIPIPESLVDEINCIMIDESILRSELLKRINSNEALSSEENNDDSIVYNQWYIKKDGTSTSASIKIRMSQEYLEDVLDKKADVTSYVFMLCIVLYVIKIKEFGPIVALSIEDNEKLMADAIDMLNRHKFFSIATKDQLLSGKKDEDELENFLSTFDRDNIDIINDILSGFRFATECNIKTTNLQLKKFADNMHWDIGFMLRIISLNFNALQNTSFSNKKNLIEQIEKLVDEYAQLPDEKNKFETY